MHLTVQIKHKILKKGIEIYKEIYFQLDYCLFMLSISFKMNCSVVLGPSTFQMPPFNIYNEYIVYSLY